MESLSLYTYFRSSAAYRVRIALNLKRLPYESRYIHLLKGGGEQHQQDYRQLNPQGLIPALVHDESGPQTGVITQSLAIIEYLEETHPQPALLPQSAQARAYVRSLALMVCCDIHPLNNLRVHTYLKEVMGVDEEKKQAWYQHWVTEGLIAIERRLTLNKHTSDFCYGDKPTIADICLIPQLYNARRFNCKLDDCPTLRKIDDNCMKLEAFQQAAPESQEDSE